jgi:hypothetical protein
VDELVVKMKKPEISCADCENNSGILYVGHPSHHSSHFHRLWLHLFLSLLSAVIDFTCLEIFMLPTSQSVVTTC